MDWLITKVYTEGVENIHSGLLGMSSLSGSGSYAIKGRLNQEAIQRAIDNECYDYQFYIQDDKGTVVAEGIADNPFDGEPLMTAHDFLLYNHSIKHIEYFANNELVNILCIDDIDEED